MKKQLLLIVSIAFLALFAEIQKVNAQCQGTATNPSTGIDYPYTVNIPAAGGYQGTGIFTWYVTQNTDLLNGTILADGSDFNVITGLGYSSYNSAIGTTNNLVLNWKPVSIGQVYYLVLKYSEANTTPGAACNAQNLKAWQIIPGSATNFLLTITGANSDGTVFNNAMQCASPLTGAQVNAGPTPTITYNYGENTLFYRVLAQGVTGDWTPSIRLPDLAVNGQTYTTVQWTSDMSGAGGWVAFSGAGGSTGGDFVSPTAASITDPILGTPILIRVVVANLTYETLADQPIQVGIDGWLPGNITSDIWGPGVWPGNPNPCAQADVFAKKATYTILARPSIDPGAGMPLFIQP